MPTIEQTQSSLIAFTQKLNELNENKIVHLDNERQVNFFLKFMAMFNAIENIQVWHFSGCDVDCEPDYENNCMRNIATSSYEAWIITLTSFEGDLERHIPLDIFDYSEVDFDENGQVRLDLED